MTVWLISRFANRMFDASNQILPLSWTAVVRGRVRGGMAVGDMWGWVWCLLVLAGFTGWCPSFQSPLRSQQWERLWRRLWQPSPAPPPPHTHIPSPPTHSTTHTHTPHPHTPPAHTHTHTHTRMPPPPPHTHTHTHTHTNTPQPPALLQEPSGKVELLPGAGNQRPGTFPQHQPVLLSYANVSPQLLLPHLHAQILPSPSPAPAPSPAHSPAPAP